MKQPPTLKAEVCTCKSFCFPLSPEAGSSLPVYSVCSTKGDCLLFKNGLSQYRVRARRQELNIFQPGGLFGTG